MTYEDMNEDQLLQELSRLTKLRESKRNDARQLKSAAIALEVGVSQSWVEKISECRIER